MIVARDARLEADWWHTANLLSQNYNMNRGKGKPSQTAEKFHPCAKKRKRPDAKEASPVEMEMLRQLLGGGNKK